MKNKKGFTLVELLAVIAILAILVIIALPNVMSMFNNAKKSSFETEVKQIYKLSMSQWMSDNLTMASEMVYSQCKSGCNNPIKSMDARSNLNYYVKISGTGKVTELYVTDGTYQYKYTGNDLKQEDIKDIKIVAELNENEILTIAGNDNNEGSGSTGPVSFATDSWDVIINAVKNNNTDVYNIGDTKEINLGSWGNKTIRIANKSNPEVCSQNDFSKTACGFVIEFVDIIFSKELNGDGWPYCSLRNYLNNDVYNALPSDLKRGIINTYVVSYHSTREGSSLLSSTDKLYLIDSNELIRDSSYTRQFDYYKQKGVSIVNYRLSNYRELIKGVEWWVRDTENWGTETGNVITNNYNNGSLFILKVAEQTSGVSPAFRIG